MKEKLLALLKTKFQGVEDATLLRIAEKKSAGVTDESQLQTIADGIGFTDVLNSYGDFRANGAVTSALTNYEKKYGLKDGKPIEVPSPDPNPVPNPADVSAIVKAAVAEAVKPYADRLTQFEGEKSAQERMTQVLVKAKEYGISEVEAKRYNIPSDADLDTFFKDVKQENANNGISSILPESAEQQIKTNTEDLVNLINKC